MLDMILIFRDRHFRVKINSFYRNLKGVSSATSRYSGLWGNPLISYPEKNILLLRIPFIIELTGG